MSYFSGEQRFKREAIQLARDLRTLLHDQMRFLAGSRLIFPNNWAEPRPQELMV